LAIKIAEHIELAIAKKKAASLAGFLKAIT